MNTKCKAAPGEMEEIVDTQQTIAGEIEHCRYVDTSQARVANDVHYDAKGTLLVGRIFAESLQATFVREK